jgi:hypothetical protein
LCRLEDLNKVKYAIKDKNLFFINDDGSHIPEHQLLTFNELFPLLCEGCIYIIEDIETSYWTKGEIYGYQANYGYKHPNSIIEVFKDVVDSVNSEFAGEKINKVLHHDKIGYITFAKNCIIIVKKNSREKRISVERVSLIERLLSSTFFCFFSRLLRVFFFYVYHLFFFFFFFFPEGFEFFLLT